MRLGGTAICTSPKYGRRIGLSIAIRSGNDTLKSLG